MTTPQQQLRINLSTSTKRAGLLASVNQHLADQHRRIHQGRARHPQPHAVAPGSPPDRPPHGLATEALLGAASDRVQVDPQ